MRNILILILSVSSIVQGFFNPEMMLKLGAQMMLAKGDPSYNECAQQVFAIINDPIHQKEFNTLFISSGKSANDLGNYERCSSSASLRYALVTVTGDEFRQQV